MEKGDRFRFVTPTLGIVSEDGHRVTVVVPQNAMVEVFKNRLDNDRMVEVLWEGQLLLMFGLDLRERAKLI